MSPKKEELIKRLNDLSELNTNNCKIARNWESQLGEKELELKKKEKEFEKATKIIRDLKNEVAELKAELAKLATKQGTTSDVSPDTNDESMPLDSPSTIDINVPTLPEAPTAQVTGKNRKAPAPEAITVYGVVDFNIFQQAILNNLTTVAHLPVFNTLGNGSIKIKAACVDSYRQILNLLKKMQEEAGNSNEQDAQDLAKIEYHCYKLKQDRNYCFIIRGPKEEN